MGQLADKAAWAGFDAGPSEAARALAARAAAAGVDVEAVALKIGSPLAWSEAGGWIEAAQLTIVPEISGFRAAAVVKPGRFIHANRLALAGGIFAARAILAVTVGIPLAGAALSGLQFGRGPGQSAAEFIAPLPEVWLEQTWPGEYIGLGLAALALLRGEGWMVEGNALIVAGRAVISDDGTDGWIESEGAAAVWVDKQVEKLAGVLGVIALPQSGVRDRLVSQAREKAAKEAESIVKSAGGIAAGSRQKAMQAESAWRQRRV
jgi:hypothetical protein